MGSSTKTKKQEEFREKQRQEAADQGQTSSNAVAEQRPVASQQVDDSNETDIHVKERERGDLDPMPLEAHERAESKSQLSKAEKEERKLGPDTLIPGTKVRVVDEDHDYFGSAGAITEVEYLNQDEAQKARSGDASVARFAKAASYLVRTRGGRHALLELKPDQVKEIDRLGIGSSDL